MAFSDQDEVHPIQLETYKPIYGLWGTPYTKIQFSFETRMAKDSRIYFGYSQLMMWNLTVPAPFFYDVNYNPLIWYRSPLDLAKSEWVDLIPEEHESNGKGFSRERSWDRIGAAYHRKFDFEATGQLHFEFRLWYAWHINTVDNDPVEHNPGNGDISEYRGDWETTFTYENFLGAEWGFDDLIFRLYPGGPSTLNPLRGGQELTLRLRKASWNHFPLLIFQIFHGYGEDLLQYDTEVFQFRAGVGF